MFESEERRIVERIKDFIKSKKTLAGTYIMLSNGRILDTDSYFNMVSTGKITPQDAYVYIRIDYTSSRLRFRYPFLVWYDDLLSACLSKLGLYHGVYIVPATGLKYVAIAVRYGDYLTIEVSNLDTVINNTNLRNIVVDALGEKLVSGENKLTGEESDKVYNMYKSQKLFAGYDFIVAWSKIINYYRGGNQLLAKEVAHIGVDYYKIFDSYRICYDMKTWKEVDCWKIKP